MSEARLNPWIDQIFLTSASSGSTLVTASSFAILRYGQGMAAQGGRQSEQALVPTLLDEQEAAALLRVKPATMRAERIRGRISYTRVGVRIFYTHRQISEYLERQSVTECEDTPPSALAKSERTGSVRSRVAIVRTKAGTEPGTTIVLDRHAVSALAQQTFKRQASVSRPGSSRTNAPAKLLQPKS